MAAKVVDASAAAAILFVEDEGDEIAQRLQGEALYAPQLLPMELGNVCLKKMRRHADQRDRLRRQFFALPSLGIEMRAVDANAVLRLAEDTGLTTYDASYLWLAETLSAELVTLDRKLAAAARR